MHTYRSYLGKCALCNLICEHMGHDMIGSVEALQKFYFMISEEMETAPEVPAYIAALAQNTCGFPCPKLLMQLGHMNTITQGAVF